DQSADGAAAAVTVDDGRPRAVAVAGQVDGVVGVRVDQVAAQAVAGGIGLGRVDVQGVAGGGVGRGPGQRDGGVVELDDEVGTAVAQAAHGGADRAADGAGVVNDHVARVEAVGRGELDLVAGVQVEDVGAEGVAGPRAKRGDRHGVAGGRVRRRGGQL